MLGKIALPPGVSSYLSGQSEEMQDSLRSLTFTLALAVLLVYLVMASQFESLVHPFVILFTIPLGADRRGVGAVAHLDAINVVAYHRHDHAGRHRGEERDRADRRCEPARAQRGIDKHDAIVVGGRARLRPIVITTLTTILGLVPMALGIGEGAEVRAPMAITVIGGLTVSTLLTLVVIPVVYSLDRCASAHLRPRRTPQPGSSRRPHMTPHRASAAASRHDRDGVPRADVDRRDRGAPAAAREQFPDIQFPGMQVTIPYAGSTPRGNRASRSPGRSRKRSRR